MNNSLTQEQKDAADRLGPVLDSSMISTLSALRAHTSLAEAVVELAKRLPGPPFKKWRENPGPPFKSWRERIAYYGAMESPDEEEAEPEGWA